jgi:hypothetical protein
MPAIAGIWEQLSSADVAECQVRTSRLRASMSQLGRVSRVPPVQTAVRNCMRDGGGPSGIGNQVLISSRRKLPSSKAMVVSVAERQDKDSGGHG